MLGLENESYKVKSIDVCWLAARYALVAQTANPIGIVILSFYKLQAFSKALVALNLCFKARPLLIWKGQCLFFAGQLMCLFWFYSFEKAS